MDKPKNKSLNIPKATLGSLIGLLVNLFRHITRRRRYQFVFLMGLTIISSLSEIVSIGIVVPFIGIFTQPEKVFNHPLMEGVVQSLNIASAESLIVPLVVTFAVAAVVAGGLRILLLWTSIRLVNGTGAELGIEVYRRTLYQPYHVHVSRGSGQIISGITQKITSVTEILMSLVAVGTLAVLFLGVLITLFVIDPMVATVSMVSFGGSYSLIAWKTRHKLERNSKCIAQEQTRVIKVLQEGLGAIRDVILDSSQAIYSGVYGKAILKLQGANGENKFITQSPRYVMEVLGILVIIILAYLLSLRPGGMGAQLPILGALAIGAQRLLPLLQQVYANWGTVLGSKVSLQDVLYLLDQPLPEKAYQPSPLPLEFKTAISFENVHFRYSDEGPWILNGVSLTIPKGARVGFIGSTGSGKSTLLDLLMSLLEPSQGRILVDDRSIDNKTQQAWQNTIAHVPQSIFLADATIAENIAFGILPEQIDQDRVRQVAKLAQIAEFIESRSEGYGAFVGEHGIRLSGGQRQRIGIARALYKQAEVIVFDEATSALDSQTEKEVIAAIENLDRDLTILIIAHRLTTLQHCDTIVRLEKGKIFTQGSYEHFKNSDPNFQNLSNGLL
jgi:ATP-binding cassette, subfamily B, bacterial PglK